MSSTDHQSREALSVQRTAIILDVHENTIHNWIRRGIILAVRTGPRLIRIPRSEIARLRVSHNAAQQATTT